MIATSSSNECDSEVESLDKIAELEDVELEVNDCDIDICYEQILAQKMHWVHIQELRVRRQYPGIWTILLLLQLRLKLRDSLPWRYFHVMVSLSIGEKTINVYFHLSQWLSK